MQSLNLFFFLGGGGGGLLSSVSSIWANFNMRLQWDLCVCVFAISRVSEAENAGGK